MWSRDLQSLRRSTPTSIHCALVPLVAAIVGLAHNAAAQQPKPSRPPSTTPVPFSSRVELMPTAVPTGEAPCIGSPAVPATSGVPLAKIARDIDLLLNEAVQDLDLEVSLAVQDNLGATAPTMRALVSRAGHRKLWEISPRIEFKNGQLLVRLVVVPPGVKHALVRTELVDPSDYQVAVVVMLRDLVRAGQNRVSTPRRSLAQQRDGDDDGKSAEKKRSAGRAVLASSAGLFGAAVGYSLQRSSGANDERLVFPLMAMGAGLGFGSAMIVAEEWDVGVGDAWYMSAGALWPTMGGWMLASGMDVPENQTFAYAMIGGLGGVGLASLSLSFKGMSEGGGALAQSGGAIGTLLGAGVELTAKGTTDDTPMVGMGYGAISGVLVGGLVARFVQVPQERVMMIDLGAGLGMLSAGAIASPLLFGDPTTLRNREWAIATTSGTVIGGVLAYWITSRPTHSTTATIYGYPIAGVVGRSQRRDGSYEPAIGLGWTGAF